MFKIGAIVDIRMVGEKVSFKSFVNDKFEDYCFWFFVIIDVGIWSLYYSFDKLLCCVDRVLRLVLSDLVVLVGYREVW